MQRDEFETLAMEHLDAVYRLALSLTRRPDEADEVVQEVYARAFRPQVIERFEDRGKDGVGGMRSWLFTICHNVVYSRSKRAAREPVRTGEFFAEEGRELAPDEPPPAWNRQSLDWEQVDETLKDAIEQLKPEYREVLLLWGVENLKYREIASILDVPIGTVMSRLHRARKTLAEALEADPEAAERLGMRNNSTNNKHSTDPR